MIKNVKEDSMGNMEFSKVLFLRIPLRLGKDVFTLGEISDERQRMMMHMIKSYKQLMKLYNVCNTGLAPPLPCATHATAKRF